jgi:hypothetical protein
MAALADARALDRLVALHHSQSDVINLKQA